MSEINFVDELPAHGRSAVLAAFADALRANPGRWAEWPTKLDKRNSIYSTASGIRAGKYRALPGADFEAVVRDGVVYARYVGTERRA